MKKIIIIYLLILVNIFAFDVIYAADACSSINFDELKCEIKIGALANLGISNKQTCTDTNLTPKKSYIDQSGNIHGVCYYEPGSNPGKGAYFYGVYKSNAKNTKCNLMYEAYVPVHRNAAKLIEQSLVSENKLSILLESNTVTESTGCAKYFYVDNLGKTNEYYTFSFEETEKYDWLDKSGIGETSYDQSDVEGIESCVLNKLYPIDCDNLETSVSDTIEKCIKDSKPAFSGDKFEQLKADVKQELINQKKIESVSLYCQFKKKCSISDENTFLLEFSKWRNNMENNNSEPIDYYNFNQLQKYFSDSNVVSCINGIYGNESEKQEIKDNVSNLEDKVGETIDKTVDEEKEKIDSYKDSNSFNIPTNPDLDIDGNVETCSQILGPNLTKLVKAAVRVVQIVGIIIVIVNSMISLIPAIVSKDQDGLKKATRKCVYMAVILVLLLLLGTIIKLIGMLFGFDTSCFI